MRILSYFTTFCVSCLGFSNKRYIPKANLAIFGVTGKTGQCVLKQASSMNKGVFSLVRRKNNIQSDNCHTPYYGDVTILDDVNQVYNGNVITGTIICLGGATSEVGNTMLTDGTKNIIECVLKSKLASKKIAIVTSIGAGDTINQPPLFFKILMNTVLKDAFVDKNNQEALFLNEDGIGKDLDFTIVRPSGLTDDNLKNVFVIEKGSGTIPRMSVAEFLLNAIYDRQFPYTGTTVCITGEEENINGELFHSKL
jgi:putative NADH-flavin reductase